MSDNIVVVQPSTTRVTVQQATTLLTVDSTQIHTHNGTYAPFAETADRVAAVAALRPMLRPGNRWVALGDSITAGSVDNSTNSNGPAWPIYASIMSQQRLHLVRDAGVAGNTSAQMLARFTTDVTPYAPNIVTILAGTNDIGGAVPFATFKTNIAALVAACRAINAVPVLGTITPRATYQATVATWNTWLRYYAEQQGLAVLDFYRIVTDPATGLYFSAFDSGDGIHPAAAGHHDMGELAAAALWQLVPNNQPLLPVDATDTSNLIVGGGLMLTDAGGNIPTGWTQNAASTGITKSYVTDALVAGRMHKILGASVPAFFDVRQTISTGFSVGDTIRACGIVTSDGPAVEFKVSFTGPGTFAKPITGITGVLTRAVFCQDFVVPATTTALVCIMLSGPNATWSGTIQWGQIGLYNLTTMGTLT